MKKFKIEVVGSGIIKPIKDGYMKKKLQQELQQEMERIKKKIDGLSFDAPSTKKKYDKKTENASETIKDELKKIGYEKDQKFCKTEHEIDLVNYTKKIAVEIEMTKDTNLLTDLVKLSIAGKPKGKKRAIEHGLIIVQDKYKDHYEMVPSLKNYFELMGPIYWVRTLGWISIKLV